MLHKVDLSAHRHTPSNADVANALDKTAQMLDERGANPHRVQAYRTAADTIRATPSLLADQVYANGAQSLEALPGVGTSLAQRIAGFVHTGEMRIQRELREQTKPERLLMRVPGIGRATARRLREELGIETLEALEIAAHDGTLAALPGFAERKLQAIQVQLGALLARSTRRDARRRSPASGSASPHIADLLSIDAEYRDGARRGILRQIAPRRFNASGEAWLPVLDTRRGPWRVTALFSNTPRAHELGKTGDWVVLYTLGESGEQTATVVTETRGELKGKRVVRGREAECREYHRTATRQAA